LAERPELFGADVLERLRLGERTTREAYAAGLAACERWRAHVAAVFDELDFVLTPTVGCEAPPIAAPGSTTSRTHALTRATFVWSFAGTPAISIPCGFTRGGLPIGMQLVGRPWCEERLLAAAQAYQEVTDHHRRVPTLRAAG
jgi:aspartyl-tRNA(Asn)/glutamyl-tRNA(Gln) amidotransferase subunit A